MQDKRKIPLDLGPRQRAQQEALILRLLGQGSSAAWDCYPHAHCVHVLPRREGAREAHRMLFLPYKA